MSISQTSLTLYRCFSIFHYLTGTLFNQKLAPSVITQTVPYTFYQVVNTRLSLV